MKNKIKFLLVPVAVAVICLIGYTGAKYISQATGEDSAAVAAWSFEVNDENIATTSAFTFNLFEQIYDTDGEEETDVVEGKIAPGTSGQFDFEIENTSEVTAQYKISLAGIVSIDEVISDDDDDDDSDGTTQTDGITVNDGEIYIGSFINYYSYTTEDVEIPIEYSTDGVNWTSDISELTLTGVLEAGESAETATIYWRWPYEGDDEQDTLLGVIAARGNEIRLMVSASIVAWQVD